MTTATAWLLFYPGFRRAAAWEDPILETIGLSPQKANLAIVHSLFLDLVYTEPYIPHPAHLQDLIAQPKASLARDLCVYVKAYCSSPDFQQRYAALREKNKPAGSTAPALPEESRKVYQQILETYEKQLNDPKFKAKPLQEQRAVQKQYRELRWSLSGNYEIAKWEWEWPADARLFLAKRLEELIDLAESIDYRAVTVKGSDGILRFQNEQYERKDPLWKAGYRAGKEVMDVAVSFASTWLKELPRREANQE